MQFTRLRLAGFKSFVDAVELDIEPGLTGIVGPNGCGKSNLVEALRWVMGESSARRLRGGEMEDVIFGGTASRPSRNVAEVALMARRNGDARPAAIAGLTSADEFEIVRRIERGHGSDYRVAGRPARARDVQMLFADAASGAHSPALVSQGRVAALIGAKPLERRQVLEDAAGIAGLHARRHEAELKLRAAEANLEKLEDLLGSMQTQLASLKKQARQATRYRELSDEIRRVEAVLLALRWQKLALREAEARQAFAASDQVVREAMLAVATATTRNADCAAILPPLRKEEAARAEALAGVVAQRDALAAEERQLALQLAEAERQAEQIAIDHAHEVRQRREAAGVEERLAAEADTLVHAAGAEPALRAAAESVLETETASVGAREAEVTWLTERVATATAEAASLARQRREAELRLTTLDKRLADERRRLEALPPDGADEEVLAASAGRLADAESDHRAAVEALAAAEAARGAADAAIGPARSADREAAQVATRLVGEQKALEGLLRSAAPGTFAPVLDQVRPRPGYEAALAASLADGLEAATDSAAPAYWQARDDRPAATPLPPGAEPLAAAVEAPPALAWAIAHIGVVETVEAGDRLAAMLTPGQSLVTRTGGLWRWDGLTRRPGAPSATTVRLEQRNRLDQLIRELAEATRAADQSAATLATADRTLRDAAAAEKQARSAADAAASRLARTRSEQAERRREAEARSVARKALAESVGRAEADRVEAASALAALDRSLAGLADPATMRSELETLRGLLGRERDRLAAARSELERIARDAVAREHRQATIANERRDWAERARRAEARLDELNQRAAAVAATRAALAERPAELAAERDRVLSALAHAEAARDEAADRVIAAESAQQASERALRGAEAAQTDARESRVRAEAAVSTLLSEKHQLALSAAERLGQSADAIDAALLARLGGVEADKLPDEDATEARAAKLARDREAIGPVNLRAELEVAELDSEIQRLRAEEEELSAAIGRLRQAVHGLNREARERLLASFGTIDAHFRRLFVQLFGGGAAELRLTESDDPLEAGLEILASPPGKKLQSLGLLSGGEQALTAIALIFAMFLTNPSPVCVLDEVDAPLDDANVDRFCALVDEIARTVGTRFLIITHHRLTMARMDRLYGVTMAERGVSQLVSVDLRHADALRAAE